MVHIDHTEMLKLRFFAQL